MARVNLPGQFNPPTYADGRIDVYAYLVLTESDVLLVDTGVGEGNAFIDARFEPRRYPVAEALRGCGVETSDVTLVVNSHLHFDHCGNNKMFPAAEIFVQERELEIARTTMYTEVKWFDFEGARLHPVSGDVEISAGIRILSSPGHTPGHQSVLVETGSGSVLIAAQAAYTADEFQRGGDPLVQAHEGFEAHYLESIARLKSVAADQVYFSHDQS